MLCTQTSYALSGLGELFGGFAPNSLHWAFEYLHRWCAKSIFTKLDAQQYIVGDLAQ